MYCIYILKSKQNSQYYIGYTNDIDIRLKLHNTNKVPSTKKLGPWGVFHTEQFQTEQEAIKRERQIKSWKSRKAIERLKFLQNRGSSDFIENPRFVSCALRRTNRDSTFSRDNIEITAHAEENKKPREYFFGFLELAKFGSIWHKGYKGVTTRSPRGYKY